MSCNPELQYKMVIVSMVTDDHSHPQHCLEKYLFTKNDDFVGCRVELLGYTVSCSFACFVSVDRGLSRN